MRSYLITLLCLLGSITVRPQSAPAPTLEQAGSIYYAYPAATVHAG